MPRGCCARRVPVVDIVASVLLVMAFTLSIILLSPTARSAAPEITGIEVKFSGETAMITWQTDSNTTTNLTYWEKDTEGLTIENDTLAGSHEERLENLRSGCDYFYIINATDEGGNHSNTGELHFTTPDFIPPRISDIEVRNLTADSAEIWWNTSENCSWELTLTGESISGSEIFSGTEISGYGQHMILEELADGMNYDFFINCTDAANNTNSSGTVSFSTPELPFIFMDVTYSFTADPLMADFHWKTSAPVSCVFRYGISSVDEHSVENLTEDTDHSAVIEGLLPDTAYLYRLEAEYRGRLRSSDIMYFVTPPEQSGETLIIITAQRVEGGSGDGSGGDSIEIELSVRPVDTMEDCKLVIYVDGSPANISMSMTLEAGEWHYFNRTVSMPGGKGSHDIEGVVLRGGNVLFSTTTVVEGKDDGDDRDGTAVLYIAAVILVAAAASAGFMGLRAMGKGGKYRGRGGLSEGVLGLLKVGRRRKRTVTEEVERVRRKMEKMKPKGKS